MVGLAALADDGEGPMSLLDAERLDVSADRLRYSQAVEGQ
jgi:hypothetical protein